MDDGDHELHGAGRDDAETGEDAGAGEDAGDRRGCGGQERVRGTGEGAGAGEDAVTGEDAGAGSAPREQLPVQQKQDQPLCGQLGLASREGGLPT